MYTEHKILTGRPVSTYVTRFELAAPETLDLSLASCKQSVAALLAKLDSLNLSYRFRGDEDVRVKEAQFYQVAQMDNMFATTHIKSIQLVVTVEVDMAWELGVAFLKSNGFV